MATDQLIGVDTCRKRFDTLVIERDRRFERGTCRRAVALDNIGAALTDQNVDLQAHFSRCPPERLVPRSPTSRS